MVVINVIKDFVLTLVDGTKREFKKGIQEVDSVLAGHWFVKAHSEPVNAKASKPAGGKSEKTGKGEGKTDPPKTDPEATKPEPKPDAKEPAKGK